MLAYSIVVGDLISVVMFLCSLLGILSLGLRSVVFSFLFSCLLAGNQAIEIYMVGATVTRVSWFSINLCFSLLFGAIVLKKIFRACEKELQRIKALKAKM